jgi:hypothetical protein
VTETSPRPSRVRPGFRRAVIVVFLLLIPFALHAAWNYVETRRLIQAILDIQARGEPVVPNHLARRTTPLTDAEQATVRFYRAAGLLIDDTRLSGGADVATYNETGERLLRDAAYRDEVARDLARRLVPQAEGLALLDRGSRVTLDALPPGAESPRVYSLKAANRVRILHRALTGEGDAAIAAIIGSLRVRRIAGGFAGIFSGNDLDAVLTYSSPSEASLASLQAEIAATESEKTLERVVLENRAAMIAAMWNGYFGYDARDPMNYNYRAETIGEMVARPWLTRRFVNALRRWEELLVAARQPYPAKVDAVAEFARRFPKPAQTSIRGRNLWTHVVWAEHMPLEFVEFSAVGIANRLALDRASIAVLAIERYRKRHEGRLPATLADLAPDLLPSVPVDPYTGKALVYKTLPASYTVYSLGWDRVDDGGKLAPVRQTFASGHTAMRPPDAGLRVLLRTSTDSVDTVSR